MSRTSGHVDGLASGAAWGLSALLLARPTIQMSESSPVAATLVIATIHDVASMLLLALRGLVAGVGRRALEVVTSRRALVIAVAGVMGGPLFMCCYIAAVVLAGPAHALTITATYPAFGAIFARLLLHQKLGRVAVSGLAATSLGAALTTFDASLSTRSSQLLLGIAVAGVAAVGLALEGVIAGRVMTVTDADTVLLTRMLFSTVLFAAAIIVVPKGVATLKTAVSTSALTAPIIAASVIGGYSYIVWYRSIRKIGAARAMALNITYAIWLVLFAWLFQSERPSLLAGVGCVVVTVGAVMTIVSGSTWRTRDD